MQRESLTVSTRHLSNAIGNSQDCSEPTKVEFKMNIKSKAINVGNEFVLPGAELAAGKMLGHWLLARLGKRVLRPGGLELTQRMLESLAIRSSDAVVEFAPGLGVTARLALNRRPASYTGIEGDEVAAARVRCLLAGPGQQCLVGSAGESWLPENSATVVYGEAMLTMQGAVQKHRIVQEAGRVLKPSGRYGIHELCLVPDDLDESIKQEIQHALSHAIHVGAMPLTSKEWRALLEAEGFEVQTEARRPMRLLEPDRLIHDEGLFKKHYIRCFLVAETIFDLLNRIQLKNPSGEILGLMQAG